MTSHHNGGERNRSMATTLADCMMDAHVCNTIMHYVVDAADWYRLVALTAPTAIGARIRQHALCVTINFRRRPTMDAMIKAAHSVVLPPPNADDDDDASVDGATLITYYPFQASVAILSQLCDTSTTVSAAYSPSWPNLRRLTMFYASVTLSNPRDVEANEKQIADHNRISLPRVKHLPYGLTHLDLIGFIPTSPHHLATWVCAPETTTHVTIRITANGRPQARNLCRVFQCDTNPWLSTLAPAVKHLIIYRESDANGEDIVHINVASLTHLKHLSISSMSDESVGIIDKKTMWYITGGDDPGVKLETFQYRGTAETLYRTHNALPTVKRLLLWISSFGLDYDDDMQDVKNNAEGWRFIKHLSKMMPVIQEIRLVLDQCGFTDTSAMSHTANCFCDCTHCERLETHCSQLNKITDAQLKMDRRGSSYHESHSDIRVSVALLARTALLHWPNTLQTVNYNLVRSLIRTKWWDEQGRHRLSLVPDHHGEISSHMGIMCDCAHNGGVIRDCPQSTYDLQGYQSHLTTAPTEHMVYSSSTTTTITPSIATFHALHFKQPPPPPPEDSDDDDGPEPKLSPEEMEVFDAAHLADMRHPARLSHPPKHLILKQIQVASSLWTMMPTMPLALWRQLERVVITFHCVLSYDDLSFFTETYMPNMIAFVVRSSLIPTMRDGYAASSSNGPPLLPLPSATQLAYIIDEVHPRYLWDVWLSRLPKRLQQLLICVNWDDDATIDDGQLCAKIPSTRPTLGPPRKPRREWMLGRQVCSIGDLLRAHPCMTSLLMEGEVFTQLPTMAFDCPAPTPLDPQIHKAPSYYGAPWWREVASHLLYDPRRWTPWPKAMHHLHHFEVSLRDGGDVLMSYCCVLQQLEQECTLFEQTKQTHAAAIYIQWTAYQFTSVFNHEHLLGVNGVWQADMATATGRIEQADPIGIGNLHTEPQYLVISPLPRTVNNTVWRNIKGDYCAVHDAYGAIDITRAGGGIETWTVKHNKTHTRYDALDWSTVDRSAALNRTASSPSDNAIDTNVPLPPLLPWLDFKVDIESVHLRGAIPADNKEISLLRLSLLWCTTSECDACYTQRVYGDDSDEESED